MIDRIKSAARGAAIESHSCPTLACLRICDGTVTGYNGNLAISEPVALSFSAAPDAALFVKTLRACKDEEALVFTSRANLLSVRCGKFKANVPCVNLNDVPQCVPEGERVPIETPFLIPTLKKLLPFMGHDPNRQWSCGILFDGQTATATNNRALAQLWLPARFPYRVNVPDVLVNELIKRDEEPVAFQLTTSSVTFHFESGAWVRSQLIATPWPNVDGILAQAGSRRGEPLPVEMFEALRTLAPFTDDLRRVNFVPGAVSTSADPTDPKGAAVDYMQSPGVGSYNADLLLALEGRADVIDFGAYPNAAPFFGEGLRGLVMGLR